MVCCILCEEVILLITFSHDNFRCMRPQNNILFNILCDCVVQILLKEEDLGLWSLTSQSLLLRSACALFKAQGSSVVLLLCAFDLDLFSPLLPFSSPVLTRLLLFLFSLRSSLRREIQKVKYYFLIYVWI